MDRVFTAEECELVKVTVGKVVAGTMTRDEAQRLLTNSGIPVLKIEDRKLSRQKKKDNRSSTQPRRRRKRK